MLPSPKRLLKAVMYKLLRALEEIVPFAYFWIYSSSYTLEKINKRMTTEQISRYSALPNYVLKERLAEEHERAVTIDEKTSKFTLVLSVLLSIVSALSSNIASALPADVFKEYAKSLFISSSIYMLSGSLLALGALKTLPKFGFGTEYKLDKTVDKLSKALASQERINLLRHARNEATYMSLRNGFLCILIALTFCAAIFFKNLPIDFAQEIQEGALQLFRLLKESPL
jgi:hypothetical protein